MNDPQIFRKYCDYHDETARACKSARIDIALGPTVSEECFESAMSAFSPEEQAAWLGKFARGFEKTAVVQKSALAAALTSSGGHQRQAA